MLRSIPTRQMGARRTIIKLVAGPDDAFARLRLTGARFDDPGMPVEALAELVAYREILVGVAKDLFHRHHPERQRVPRGFTDRLQLRLSVVEPGSAVPVLERVPVPGTLMTVEDEFTEARDLILDAVAAVVEGRPLPDGFPRDSLVLFNRFGQTLRPDEGIELVRAGSTTGPTYTPSVRKALVLNDRPAYQEEVQGIGWISELDAEKMRCSIRLRGGPSNLVSAPLDEVTFESARDALAPNGEGPPVRITGVGVFDVADRLIRFDSLHEVTVRDDDLSALDRRLDELAALQPGWLNEEAEQLDPRALRQARAILTDLLSLDVPRPRVYPTPHGGIQAEWTIDEFEISITFEPDGSLYIVSVNGHSGAMEEPQLVGSEQIAQFVLRAS